MWCYGVTLGNFLIWSSPFPSLLSFTGHIRCQGLHTSIDTNHLSRITQLHSSWLLVGIFGEEDRLYVITVLYSSVACLQPRSILAVPQPTTLQALNGTILISQFSHSVVSDSLRPHGLQHARLPCPSPTPQACSIPCPSSQWCHPTISSSVIPFSSHLQSFPASGSFQMSQFFASGGQSIGVSASASVLLMNIQDWFPLELTGLISLQSKGLSRVFSNTTVQKHQFFGFQLSL